MNITIILPIAQSLTATFVLLLSGGGAADGEYDYGNYGGVSLVDCMAGVDELTEQGQSNLESPPPAGGGDDDGSYDYGSVRRTVLLYLSIPFSRFLCVRARACARARACVCARARVLEWRRVGHTWMRPPK